MSKHAWVTLATNDSYALGALVLAKSLKSDSVHTKHSTAIIITPGVTNAMRDTLHEVFEVVYESDILDSKDEANLALIKRPELGITFTKLSCWTLTQFDKCVFLDADILVLQNCDELFDYDELSAAPDVGWPDCFNSGVFVFKPNLNTYKDLLSFAEQHGSFDGGDQGLLNLYFSDWRTNPSKRLPFLYNTSISTVYTYLPAFRQFEAQIKIVHFLGAFKPWQADYDLNSRRISTLSPQYQHLSKYVEKWWDLFCETVHPKLREEMGGLAGTLARSTVGSGKAPCIDAWQQGDIDYMGVDSFSNILSKIEETLEKKPLLTEDPQPEAIQVEKSSTSTSKEVTQKGTKEVTQKGTKEKAPPKAPARKGKK